ncbi:hypothetical protein PENSPDRAFT_693406 [Peniophora sp. CONT]|nr:hypothetical protein PENSPDRAFT_693406 [Peniophora sp. CONT]
MEGFALQLALKCDPDKPALLYRLGKGLRAHFERYGNIHALQLSVTRLDLSNKLTPLSDAEKPSRLAELGISLRTRFNHQGQIDDLELALALHRLAVYLMPEGVDNPTLLREFGKTLRTRFQRLGALDDLEHSIILHQQAIELTPDGNSDRPRLGELEDLERAISAEELTLELTPEGHPDKPVRLAILAVSLWSRYKCHGELEDLERAISAEELALELTPKGHPDKPDRLANLAVSLRERYNRHGELDDLGRAISAQECALDLTPQGHPDKAARLEGLAISLVDRFRRYGEFGDLERAITLHQHSVKLTPKGHPDKLDRLASLAVSLGERYRCHGELEDLECAINVQEVALELTPEAHSDKPVQLGNLAVLLGNRYRRHGKLEDLELTINIEELSLELTPEGHRDKPNRLANIAVSLGDRYKRRGELQDLERAITTGQLAVNLTSQGGPEEPERLTNLGVFLLDRYRQCGRLEDLEHSISLHGQAVQFTPDGHLDKVTRLYNLGISSTDLFEKKQTKLHFDAAIDYLMQAATQSLGDPYHRLNSAQKCVSLLSAYTEFSSADSLLLAHSRIIQVFPEIVWLGHSVDRRFKELGKLKSLVNDAASAFIRARSRYQAIEWMETGRSLVWSQITSLRTPLDEKLEQMHPGLASDLRKVLSKLTRPGNTSHSSFQHPIRWTGTSQPLHSEGTMSHTVTLEATANRHRQLVIQYDRLLNEIRSHSGFEHFMRPPGIQSLLPSIEGLDGPVVFINVHASSCDALALFPHGAVRHIPLPSLTDHRACTLRCTWIRCLQSSDRSVRAVGTYDCRVVRGGTSMLGLVLGRLWTWIVHPILEALGSMNSIPSNRLPHITWCPTGPLTQLPLHAAGIYDLSQTDRPHVFDFVVSSYTPSLTALLRCRNNSRTPSAQPNLLIIAQPATPGLSPLPGTHDECARIQELLPASSFLKHEQATIADTLSVMGQYPWLHLACHGFQDKSNPTQSAFALYDGRLTLSALMETVAENSELAFLSACETAVGDEKIPEESAHLAAGMLAVGFKGVIATMWSIGDADAPIVVEAYYKKLLELRSSGDKAAGYTGAAYALHEAVKVLREHVGEQNFVKWAPFVHFGV